MPREREIVVWGIEMPTYEYRCKECGIVFERFQHFSEEPVRVCPECQGAVHRVIHPVGIVFKGKGFYITDNRGDRSALLPKNGQDKDKDKDKSTSKVSESTSTTVSEPTTKSDAKAE